MKILPKIAIAVFVALLWLPMIQRSTKLLPLAPLQGAEGRMKRPVLSAKTWFDGTWQRNYERWFSTRIGLRDWLVRTWNQVNFTLFGTVARNKGTRVMVGRDGWLYEGVYVDVYNKEDRTPDSDLRERVDGLARLQAELRRRGIGFAVVISPSKVEIYPEFAPEGALTPGRENRKTAYDRLAPLLADAGIDVIDGHRFFREAKTRLPHPLFSRGGVHWNYYGAGFVVSQMLQSVSRQTGRDVGTLVCTNVVEDSIPYGTDNDLGELLNLWPRHSLAGPQVHPQFESRTGAGGRKANFLLVGDSFGLTLAQIMESENLVERCDLLFYYNRRFVFPGEVQTPFDRRRLDVRTEILGRDAVILAVNEYWFPNIGFGFVQDALRALEKDGP